jgi:hypothetical protein|tara:strand:- start:1080 stop:1922 length:843 start_codon:yes stop_codon:yes gene_type:complete
MNRFISKKAILLSLITLVLLTNQLLADSEGRATIYKVTMEKVELCTGATCIDPTLVCNSSMVIDIASVSVGSDVAAWCDMSGLPIGITYSHVRVHLQRKFTIAGYTVDSLDNPAVSGKNDCHTGGADGADGTTELFSLGTDLADASGVTPTEQVMYIQDGDGVQDLDVPSSANCCSSEHTNLDDSRPIGSTAWCVGSTTGHAMAAAQCINTANSFSNTWELYANANTVQIIYPLEALYTSSRISPKLSLAFSTKLALSGVEVNQRCHMFAASPLVTMRLE